MFSCFLSVFTNNPFVYAEWAFLHTSKPIYGRMYAEWAFLHTSKSIYGRMYAKRGFLHTCGNH